MGWDVTTATVDAAFSFVCRSCPKKKAKIDKKMFFTWLGCYKEGIWSQHIKHVTARKQKRLNRRPATIMMTIHLLQWGREDTGNGKPVPESGKMKWEDSDGENKMPVTTVSLLCRFVSSLKRRRARFEKGMKEKECPAQSRGGYSSRAPLNWITYRQWRRHVRVWENKKRRKKH